MFSLISKFCLLAVVGLVITFINPVTVSAAPSVLDELAERIEGSPLQIFSILNDSLERGVVSVDADWGEDTHFAVSLYSNHQNQDYGLSIAVNDNWVNFDVDIFANRERVAARASAASNNFFGVQFATLAQDLLIFLDGLYELGFIPDIFTIIDEVNELEVYLNYLDDFMNLNSIDIMDYIDIIAEALLQIEQTSERTVIRSAGRSVGVQRNSFTMEVDTLFSILIDMIERTEELVSSEMNNLIFTEMRHEIYAAKENVEGFIVLAFYTERTGRLRRVAFEINTVEFIHSRYHEENATLILDFGSTATDIWVLELVDSAFNETKRLTWVVEENEENSAHIFTATTYTEWGNHLDKQIITIDWNLSTYDLVFSYENHSPWREATIDSVAGLLTMDNTSFTLQFSEDDLNIKLSAVSGVSVPNIDFINLDRWIYYLPELEAILNLFG